MFFVKRYSKDRNFSEYIFRYTFLVFLIILNAVNCQILTPPYFNLAEGRRAIASATCGEDVQGPELYCKLVGANAERNEDSDNLVIQGQVCDHCDPSNPDKHHPAEKAVDGRESWWQSPPLSRGMKYNEVNLTIDLGQEFHVAYVIIKMANSPRPGVWALERSSDNGQTFQPWQYFADSPGDCQLFFGTNITFRISADDSVICDTQFSKIVPLEGGEIIVPLVQNRPSANDFFNSTVLQEWTRATNVRFRFLRVKNLLGHLMSVARQDPTTTRRYFYSIRDISIGGRCRCNGHADICDIQDPYDTYKLICNCQHNTCGHNCEICCPGYEQKRWSQSKSNKLFVCEKCNCFGHSDQCIYNETIDNLHLSLDIHGNYEGGGVCQNCQHNTEGVNCDRCIGGYYRPFQILLNDTNVCQPCRCEHHYETGNCYEGTGKCECKPEYLKPNCDACSFGYYGYPWCRPCECYINGTRGFQCESGGGQCPCKPNFGGKYCKQCSDGHYNYPECKPCDCNQIGSSSNICDINTGNCKCKSSFGGRSCDQCTDGYFSFPSCLYCNCDIKGTVAEVCNKLSGQCVCKQGYGGSRCDQCIAEYTGFPDCKPCNCSTFGSVYRVCDPNGKCQCLQNFAGKTCDQCYPGYYQYPDCLPCDCSVHGMVGVSCDNDGRCKCKPNFDGVRCDKCKEGFYNYPVCEECNFDPAGVLSTFSGCSSLLPGELVLCKPKVQGRICNECQELYWNLQARNPDGCQNCECRVEGTIGRIGSCDSVTGQCICKPSVTFRQCDKCKDGYYSLSDQNLFGCTDCGCDIGGSITNVCDKQSGQCICQPRINGKTCKDPLLTHYYPTLHQYQYEVEDGLTPARTPVRYGFNGQVFPDYSWRGYAVFSQLQNETVHEVVIDKPSIYRMIFRYVNRNDQPIVAGISLVPEDPNNIDTDQKFQVLFKPARNPTFVTVAGVSGNNPAPLVLNPGPWRIKIISQVDLFLDYFVLIPAEFYEADLLVYNVESACLINTIGGLCRHYQYPIVSQFDQVRGEGGHTSEIESKQPLQQYFEDSQHLKALGVSRMPVISMDQPEIYLDMRLTKPGAHMIIVNYATTSTNHSAVIVELEAISSNQHMKSALTLYPCKYTMLCRQVALDREGRVARFDFDTNFIRLVLKGDGSDTIVGIDSVVAIPKDKWSLNYIQPKPGCVRKDGKCVSSTYLSPPDSKRFDFKTGNEERIAKILPNNIYENITELIYLDHEDAMIDISGKVPNPGPYIFVVHYYQPDFPEYDMTALVHNGQTYEAKFPVQHCPSNSGCRSVVQQKDGNTVFQLDENFWLTLKEPDHHSIWVHYLLVIPTTVYSEDIIQEQPFDQTSLFISECGKNSFYLNTSEPGFCQEATFSLTTKYNHGALPCHCDFDGSYSLECNKFGGQCACRENVIGRRCDSCRTGYFGFPYCRSCDCPSTAFCEPTSGDCICPLNVIGEKCNQCQPYTFGYHPIIGCEECNCNVYGVKNDNLQCDLNDGSCACKRNVEGRTCDHCSPGFWYFPQCILCECDLRGATEEICNQTNASCFCKKNVQGVACDICKDGTYNLQPDNEEGCTKCFCFGKTTRCTSSTLFKSEIMATNNWKLANVNVSKTVEIVPLELIPDNTPYEIAVDMTLILSGITYFVAPDSYLGNKLTAYGGFFNFTILYTTSPYGTPVSGPDVILQGSNMYVFYYSIEQPASNIQYPSSLQLVEKNFVTISNSAVTREQLMQVLQNLNAIYVRASYWDQSLNVKLTGPRFEIGVPEYSEYTSIAMAVEQCQCPPNYVGLSCEDCADGYYRASTGPFGGYCIPCQCNGHANTCDKTTGICHRCRHNTRGEHCEKCEIGFYGNATFGTPNDCLICACPLPISSNNFATGCEISDQGIPLQCECKEGYTGKRCEVCAAGYYGRPDNVGGICALCECNGNIDPKDPDACDPITGRCTKCLNNTYGDACEICAPGFFGDAIKAKSCQSCLCDKCGTDKCDHTTGQCFCHRNVVGEKCDRCADTHYGFSTCSGCTPCDCGLASESMQCDDVGGHCRCKPGAFGRTCERCEAGYWQYSADGCTSCGCNTGYSIGVGCNPMTGLCECLPGVIGDKCNQCPHRWVLLANEGCMQCDDCTHGLLNMTDELEEIFQPVVNQFETVAVGYFMVQRLLFINNTANSLRPNITDILAYQFDLTPYISDISELDKSVHGTHREAKELYLDALELAKKGSLTYKDALEVQAIINKVIDATKATVYELNNLAYRLETGAGPQTDYALNEGKRILTDIQNNKVDDSLEKDATERLITSEQLLVKAKEFNEPIKKISDKVVGLRTRSEIIDNKLDELQNYTEIAQHTAAETVALNQINKNIGMAERVNALESKSIEANALVSNATILVAESAMNLDFAKKNYEEMAKNRTSLNWLKSEAEEILGNRTEEYESVKPVIQAAQHHAEQLAIHANILESLILDSRVSSESAVQAATAYKNIVQAIADASNSANEANNAAINAAQKSEGLLEKAIVTQNSSMNLLAEARVVLVDIQRNLSIAGIQVGALTKINQQIKNGFDEINTLIDLLKPKKLVKRSAERVRELKPEEVTKNAQDTLNSIQNITKNLPDDLIRAELLYRDEEDKSKYISQTLSHVNRIEKLLPNVSDTFNRLKTRPSQIYAKDESLKSMLEDLKQRISSTRDLVDKIKVGVNISKSTWLKLRVPSNVQNQGTSSYISVYFKTSQIFGIIFYLGNEIGTHKKLRKWNHDDFLALTLSNGYPELIIDIGSGTSKIQNEKFVSDNKWYQAIIERTGKSVKLSILDELGKDQDYKIQIQSKELVLSGTSSVLNLDRNHSHLYVGGFPASFDVQSDVEYNSFSGQLEELTIGETVVGLWNFIEVGSSTGETDKWQIINGTKERDRFVRKASSTGCRFNGEGYVMLSSRGYDIQKRTDIILRFKSSASDGILFLAFKNNTFLSIELRQGYILYQYNVGLGLVTMYTAEQYNDDQWHAIEIVRVDNRGELKVDGMIKQTSPATAEKSSGLPYVDYFFVGGYPNDHKLSHVTKMQFDGCIDQMQIDGTSVDLNRNANARGITAGCPFKFSSAVSFEEGSRGYAHWANSSGIDNYHVELTFRFKTALNNAIMVYGVDGKVSLMLLLVNGNVVFRSGGQEVSTNLFYNDNQWHNVMAIHNEAQLQLIMDDFDTFKSSGSPGPIRFLYGSLYFGSVPSGVDASAAFEKQFVGCIADATLNGVIINFANLTDVPGATIGKCSGPPQKAYTGSETVVPGTSEAPATRPSYTTITTTSIPVVTKAPVKIGECALPLSPATDSELTDQSGYRFGISKNSGLVYEFDLIQTKKRYEFSLEIKTISMDGIIFYASNRTKNDFIAVYLKEGKVHFTFSSSISKPLTLVSDVVDDGEWHTISFSFNQKQAKLIIDNSDDQQTADIANKMSIEPPYHLGAIQSDTLQKIKAYLQDVSGTFEGCIRNFKVNGNLVGDATKSINVIPCSNKVESGVFFPADGGYIKAKERFRVGKDVDIKLEIKPRHVNGLLFSVHAEGREGKKSDFIVLQMVNGSIQFSVDNGNGIVQTAYMPPSPYYFCDGQWHTIEAVKNRNVIVVSVDKVAGSPGIDFGYQQTTDTNNPLYFGGHPAPRKYRSIENSVPYVGCMRYIEINGQSELISGFLEYHNVFLSVCPTI